MRIIGFMLMCIVGAIVVSNSSNWVLASEPSFSIVRQGAESKFPEGVRFFLEVNSIEPITDIRVYFEKMGQSSRRSYRSLEFEEGTSVSAEFLMRSGSGGQYIPPGTRIEYFFEIYDDAGEANQTEEVTFIYLEDSTKKNGATKLVPKSHKILGYPAEHMNPFKPYEKEIPKSVKDSNKKNVYTL